MPPDDAAAGVGRTAGGGEDVWPAELAIGVGIFHGQGVREIDTAIPLVEVLLMEDPDAIGLAPQGSFQGAGQQGGAILLPLAVAADDVSLGRNRRP